MYCKRVDMRYIRPEYYNEFSCTADKCPDTCCAGWQIMIDETSLEKYGAVKGAFGKRLRNSIDWEEGSFYQYNRRCAFLNEQNLCDLYTALGGDSLCDTCRNYPRHVEEYEGLRELSLSLSCPIAAEIILSQDKFPVLEEYEDDLEEELEDEFEDFDLLLFTQLEDARGVILEHLEHGAGVLAEKMPRYIQMAQEMQDCISREAYFEIEEVVNRYREYTGKPFEGNNTYRNEACDEERYSHMQKLFGHIIALERLREEWSEVLEQMQETLYAGGRAQYMQCLQEFQAYLEEGQNKKQWEDIGVRLFVFFLYTYFCGAVYDDWIYSKMALAVRSVEFIRELLIVRWKRKGKLELSDYVELSYRYAREIEHSDLNLNALEEIFMAEYEEVRPE